MKTYQLFILYFALSAALFCADLALPLGVAAGVPHVLPILVTLWTQRKLDTYILAVIGSLLTIIGYFLSPLTDGVPWMVATNRLLAIFVILITAIFVIKRKDSEKKITLLNLELEQLANTDPLTKAGNRLLFNTVMKSEMARAERYNYQFSLIMFDIDHFKKVNDTFGHDTGDKVLVSLTKLVSGRIRETDALFRIGGEEFIVILAGTNIDNAKNLAHHLLSTVNQFNIDHMKGVTISIGVASFEENDTIECLVKKADSAMYESKEDGRNRVTVFS